MTRTNGTVAYRAEYDPHGQRLLEWSDVSTGLNTHKFTGHEFDAATGLEYANARMYTHNRGRFMQPDKLGLRSANRGRPQTLNRYGYVNNDPVNFIDPSGLFNEFPHPGWWDEWEDPQVITPTGPGSGGEEIDPTAEPDEVGGGVVQANYPLQDLRKYLSDMLNKPSCGSFFDGLQKILGTPYPIDVLFSFVGSLNFTQVFRGGIPQAGAFQQNPDGSFSITISPIQGVANPNIPGGDPGLITAQWNYFKVLAHELLHFGGFSPYGNSHATIANAILDMKNPDNDGYVKWLEQGGEGPLRPDQIAEKLIDYAIKRACPNPLGIQ